MFTTEPTKALRRYNCGRFVNRKPVIAMGNGVPEPAQPDADAGAFERLGQVPEALDARAGSQQDLTLLMDHQQSSFQMNCGWLGALDG